MPTYPIGTAFRPWQGGTRVAFDITTPTVIKVGMGRVVRVYVNTAPTAAGGVYDASTTTTSASDLIANIGTTEGILFLDAPYYVGLLVDPGTGGVVSVSYD